MSYKSLTTIVIPLSLLLLAACSSSSVPSDEPVAAIADRDADTIADADDNCPDVANRNQIDRDSDGIGDACEADTDGDSIIDDDDQCPNTDPALPADQNGCADNQRDTDNDGISDDLDQCPGTPPGASVGPDGCPLPGADADADGISDADDVCPDSVTTDSNGQPIQFFPSGCPRVTLARDGLSYDVFLTSNVDGERIAFTVHEPRVVDPADSYPIIGQGHGYSQSRTSGRPAAGGSGIFSRLVDAQYGMFSMDQRGHGESGGQIRLLDPEIEGLDMIQILDFLETNLSWLDFSEGGQDYLLGGIGSSYGGGFQHTLLRLDPLQRLDAMSPDITWYDLRYSINTNRVFKTKWALLLSGLANSTPGGHHEDVNNGLQRGLSEGQINAEERQLVYRSSMAYNCDATNTGDFITGANGVQIDVGRPITPIPAFYSQGPSDTLFDLTEAFNNYQCLRNIDPNEDVRLFTQLFGHDDLVGAARCGGLTVTDMRVAFFDQHLKGIAGSLDGVPDVCLNLANQSISRTAAQGFPVGNDGDPANSFDASLVDPFSGTPIPFAFSEGNASIQNVEVYVAQSDGEILAGIPTIELEVTRDAASANVPSDAVLFVGIAISTNNGASYELPNQSNSTGTGQTTPFRDTDIIAGEVRQLAGVTAILDQGHRVAVQYLSRDNTYQNSGTRAAISGTISATVHLPLLGVRGVDQTAFPAP